jgi:hypothetical protein
VYLVYRYTLYRIQIMFIFNIDVYYSDKTVLHK